MKRIVIALVLISSFTASCKEEGCDPPMRCIDGTRIDSSKLCPEIYEPVCGCNRITYTNSCVAGKNGVTYWERGACDSLNSK